MKRYYIVCQGRVQGVGFRYFCLMNATEYNLTGWVHNMSNGMVEMEVQGEENNLDKFLIEIRKGTYFIRVDEISMKPKEVIPDEKKFKVK